MATDNTPAHAWITRGSTSSISAPAFLLSLLASDSQHHNALLSTAHTPGKTNTIADFLSRSFTLSDADVLATLQSMVPVQPPWQLVTPTKHMISTTNWALSRKLPPTVSAPPEYRVIARHGLCGHSSVTTSPVTPSYKPLKILSRSSKYSLSDTEWEHWLPPPLQSKLAQWKAPFVPLGRLSPHWGSGIPGCNLPESLTSDFIDNSNVTQKTIRPLTGLSQYHSRYYTPLSHSVDAPHPKPHTRLPTC
jgi:hypothetical protein